MIGDCALCWTAEKQSEASTVFEDHLIMACLDIRPAAKGHLLIFPKKHVAGLQDLSVYLAGYLFSLVPSLVRAVSLATGCSGVNLRINQGASAGQDVFHVHIHLVPRYAGDGLDLTLGHDLRLPETASESKRAELDAVAAEIKAKLGTPTQRQD